MLCRLAQGVVYQRSVANSTSAVNSRTSAGIWFCLLDPRPTSDFTAVLNRHVCSPAQRGHSQHILHHLAHTSGNDPIPALGSTYISVNYFGGSTSFEPIHNIIVRVICHQGKQQIIPSCARAGECFLAAVQPYDKLM